MVHQAAPILLERSVRIDSIGLFRFKPEDHFSEEALGKKHCCGLPVYKRQRSALQ